MSDESGRPISSEDRATRFAECLERVQWKVRPAELIDDVPSLPTLPVFFGGITLAELRAAAKTFKPGRAVGLDGTPIEFWKTVLNNGASPGASFLLEFCDADWSGKKVPESWHLQRVVLL